MPPVGLTRVLPRSAKPVENRRPRICERSPKAPGAYCAGARDAAKSRNLAARNFPLRPARFDPMTRVCCVLASALFFTTIVSAAEEQRPKPPIRGLVSMGAFKFVGSGGDPVNTLEPLNA